VIHAGDSSNRLFVVELRGRIRVLDPGASTPRPTPFLDIPQCQNVPAPALCVRTDFENGLMGMAFHPNHASNGRLFIHYIDRNDDSVIAEVRVSATDPNIADLTTITPILRIDHGWIYHRGGDLAFGPDGYLYIPMGDGSNQGDPCRRGQTLTPAQLAQNDTRNPQCPAQASFVGSGGNPSSRALLSKLIRIDVDQVTPPGTNQLCGSRTDGSAPYAIPPSNPYAGDAGVPGACDETFSYGWRNPFRFSIDPPTGDIFLGDVGNATEEEISRDHISGAGNRDYGWLCSFTDFWTSAPPRDERLSARFAPSEGAVRCRSASIAGSRRSRRSKCLSRQSSLGYRSARCVGSTGFLRRSSTGGERWRRAALRRL
jgi:glucose/arabinose dehydrogenase